MSSLTLPHPVPILQWRTQYFSLRITYFLMITVLFFFGVMYLISLYFVFSASQAEMTGHQKLAFQNYKKAITVFPFEDEYWKKWLTIQQANINNVSINQLLKWHSESNLLNYKIGLYFFKALNLEAAIYYYKSSILFSPHAIESYEGLINIYSKDGQWSQAEMYLLKAIYQSLLLEPLTFSHEELINHPLKEISVEFKGYLGQKLPLSLNSEVTNSSLYLQGLGLIKENRSSEAIPFWQALADINPSWSHVSIELASLYLSEHREDSAQVILQRCSKDKYAKEHCLYAQQWLKDGTFPKPGSLAEEIIN